MRYDDFKEGLSRGFQLQADCERGGFECFNADLSKLDEQSVVYDDVNDINKPKYDAAKNITPCADWRECGELVTSLCAANELGFFRYLEESKSYEAYCTSIVGYEQKKQPKLAENTQKKQAKQAKAQEREARRAARASGEARMARLAGQSDLTAAESREVALWLLKRELNNE
jgi:hypothetical protein